MKEIPTEFKKSEVKSIRLSVEEVDMVRKYSEMMALSGSRFFAKAITDYLAMIEAPPGHPIKTPPFLKYCRSIAHGNDDYLQT